MVAELPLDVTLLISACAVVTPLKLALYYIWCMASSIPVIVKEKEIEYSSLYNSSLQGEMESLDHLAADIADRLVRRPLDLPTAVEGQIKHFKDNILRPLEVLHIVVLALYETMYTVILATAGILHRGGVIFIHTG